MLQSFNLNPTSPIVEKRTIQYKGNPYDIYNIDKNFLPFDDVPNRAYRSAIVQNGKLVCIAPAKSINSDHFDQIIASNVPNPTNLITHIVEGTMVNLFWDEYQGSWEIATRRNIGGNCSYFAQDPRITFRQMFLDALGISSIDALASDPDFAFLNKECCYSFVVQHPKNHFVLIIDKPAAYLVHIYRINNNHYSYEKPDPSMGNGCTSMGNGCTSMGNGCTSMGNGRILFASTAVKQDIDNLNNPLNSPDFVGVMITNCETGLRTSMYGGKYLEVKALRGNNPCLHYQYLNLRKIGKVNEFLGYFPQYADAFKAFAEYFNRFKARIHQLYMDVHVLKKIRVTDISEKSDKYYVEKLHYDVYLPGLAKYGKVFRVNKKVVEEFLDRENIMIPMGKKYM